MSIFFQRLSSAIILSIFTFIGLYFFRTIFLFFISMIAMFELNKHFKKELWSIFTLYSLIILIGILSFALILQYFGYKYIIFLLLTVCSNDIFAYIVGSTLKGRKLCPNISPNKTISGLFGGLLFALIFGYLFSYYFELNISITSINIIILLSIIGDLIESYIKRLLNIKDFMNFIPGHGGILDRLDSLILPSIYLYFALNS